MATNEKLNFSTMAKDENQPQEVKSFKMDLK